MPTGPGKYGKLCTLVRHRAHALGAVVIVIGGEHGSGFSIQLPPEEYAMLAAILRDIVAEIERSGPKTH